MIIEMLQKAFVKISIISFLLLISCSQTGPCNEKLSVVNPLPDITIKLENGNHSIDLTNPPVFEHSTGEPLAYDTIVIEGLLNLNTDIRENPKTGKFSLLVMEPTDIGNATVVVEAGGDCIESVQDDFNVSIK